MSTDDLSAVPRGDARASGAGHEEIRELVRRLNAAGGTYHRLRIAAGLVVEGVYDMEEVLPAYGLPDDLSGQSALDVGCASGFFALELARRGAEVTAIDLWEEHPLPTLAAYLDLPVRYERRDLYELDRSFGRFDLVLCGSVLQHLWDPFNALCRLRSVCRGLAVVATPVISRRRFWKAFSTVADFIGTRVESSSGQYWVTWKPSRKALARMLTVAGFDRVSRRGEFRLRSLPGHGELSVPHTVLHARVDGS